MSFGHGLVPLSRLVGSHLRTCHRFWVLRFPGFSPSNFGGLLVSFDRIRTYRKTRRQVRNTTLRAFVRFLTRRHAVRKPFGISNPQTLHVTLLKFCCVHTIPLFLGFTTQRSLIQIWLIQPVKLKTAALTCEAFGDAPAL